MKLHEVVNAGKSLVGMEIKGKTDFAGKP